MHLIVGPSWHVSCRRRVTRQWARSGRLGEPCRLRVASVPERHVGALQPGRQGPACDEEARTARVPGMRICATRPLLQARQQQLFPLGNTEWMHIHAHAAELASSPGIQ